MILGIKKKQKVSEPSLRDIYNKRNKIVVIRNSRGIGDILNARMLLRNFKKLAPELHITFACFKEYFCLIQDCVDDVIESSNVNKNDFMASYDISNCCIHYESREMSHNTKHRVEIWAEHCGLPLEDHDMGLPFISKEKINEGRLELNLLNTSELRVLFCPIAHEKLRTLTKEQIEGVVEFLHGKKMFVYSTHKEPIKELENLNVPVLVGKTLEDWMSYVHAADYVVTVDTSTFHYAGGIGKPMTGIFTHVDGKLRGKFYDFVLVQKHRDNGDWPCGGPCYNFLYCSHPKCMEPVIGPNNQRSPLGLRPCLTELSLDEIKAGIEKMLIKWHI